MEKLGKKLKHDHTLTSILKFAIFSLVMLAPVFSIASRCLYVICNKNAKDSYSNQYVQQYSAVNNVNQFTDGSSYILNVIPTSNTAFTAHIRLYFYETSLDFYDLGFNNIQDIQAFSITDHINNGNRQWSIRTWSDDTTSLETKQVSYDAIKTINIVYKSYYTGNSYTPLSPTFYHWSLIYITTDKLDNAFEYSLSQLEESNYYNWATNLGIYTPIYNMVHGLGGHDIIALLLAYWSIYTAIYIVFDIIIVVFVKITHFIQAE